MCTLQNSNFWMTINRIIDNVDSFFKRVSDKIEENINNISPSFVVPKYDVVEFDDCYYIRVEVCGMDTESLYTDIKENNRSISIYMKKNRHVDFVSPHEIIYTNRSYGMCRLFIKLPENVESNSVVPSYENGILTVLVYKKDDWIIKKDCGLLMEEFDCDDESFDIYMDGATLIE